MELNQKWDIAMLFSAQQKSTEAMPCSIHEFSKICAGTQNLPDNAHETEANRKTLLMTGTWIRIARIIYLNANPLKKKTEALPFESLMLSRKLNNNENAVMRVVCKSAGKRLNLVRISHSLLQLNQLQAKSSHCGRVNWIMTSAGWRNAFRAAGCASLPDSSRLA